MSYLTVVNCSSVHVHYRIMYYITFIHFNLPNWNTYNVGELLGDFLYTFSCYRYSFMLYADISASLDITVIGLKWEDIASMHFAS